MNPRLRYLRGGKSLSIILIGCFASVAGAGAVMRAASRAPIRVLDAEFETRAGILLAWPNEPDWPNYAHSVDQEGRDAEQQVLIDVMAALHDSVPTACLVPDDATRALIQTKLKNSDVPLEGIEFIQAPINSMWVRDFGPIFARGLDGNLQILDTKFVRTHHRFEELDKVPTQLGRRFGIPVHRVRVEIDGGEILSNGSGLCVVAEREQGPDGWRRAKLIKRQLGAKQVVFVQSLFKEATGHVDMFATFTSPDTIVVGEYPKDYDYTNALILDQNAARLRKVRTSRGLLKVVRIPMPPRNLGHYCTYTNVVYANGRLLFPRFSNVDPRTEAKAMDVYRKLLPEWEIVPIEATPLIKYEGSLHCLTASLYQGNKQATPESVLPDNRFGHH